MLNLSELLTILQLDLVVIISDLQEITNDALASFPSFLGVLTYYLSHGLALIRIKCFEYNRIMYKKKYFFLFHVDTEHRIKYFFPHIFRIITTFRVSDIYLGNQFLSVISNLFKRTTINKTRFLISIRLRLCTIQLHR